MVCKNLSLGFSLSHSLRVRRLFLNKKGCVKSLVQKELIKQRNEGGVPGGARGRSAIWHADCTS